MMLVRPALLLILAAVAWSGLAAAEEPQPVHALAMLSEPKYPARFDHLEYVNPQATKGGTLALGADGSFDSFNPFILRGVPAAGADLPFETLTQGSLDEPFS